MSIEPLLQTMTPITLEEMSGVKLMNRVDTKFLTTVPKLLELLKDAGDVFFVQEANEYRNSPYYTRYYDTGDVRMYYDHQRGKKSRRKIRIREYVNSDAPPFLEIKDKNNKGRTKKKRIAMEVSENIEDFGDFIEKYSEFQVSSLNPVIENSFNRITLVNQELTERITIDTSLKFHNFVTDLEISLPELVIIEWKRDGLSEKSRLKPLLRAHRIQESGFSKYVIGMAMTDSSLPQNRYKKRLRLIDKIMR